MFTTRTGAVDPAATSAAVAAGLAVTMASDGGTPCSSDAAMTITSGVVGVAVVVTIPSTTADSAGNTFHDGG